MRIPKEGTGILDSKQEMLQTRIWAVVGASDHVDKFGYKIFKFLVESGLEVYPVNPGITEILGKKCYARLQELPVKPEAVNVVVPPRIGKQIMHDCNQLGITNVWLQPGADADEIIKVAAELGLNVVHHACIMVELRKKEE